MGKNRKLVVHQSSGLVGHSKLGLECQAAICPHIRVPIGTLFQLLPKKFSNFQDLKITLQRAFPSIFIDQRELENTHTSPHWPPLAHFSINTKLHAKGLASVEKILVERKRKLWVEKFCEANTLFKSSKILEGWEISLILLTLQYLWNRDLEIFALKLS